MDVLHRILTGQTLTKNQLVFGGCFVLFWFFIDMIEFMDWFISKF